MHIGVLFYQLKRNVNCSIFSHIVFNRRGEGANLHFKITTATLTNQSQQNLIQYQIYQELASTILQQKRCRICISQYQTLLAQM